LIQDTVSAIKNLFKSRAHAYRMVFDEKNQYTKTVLKDLAKFCRAHESTFHKDERQHAVLEGRREVFLRILEHLNLEADEFMALHRAKELAK
jgi:hypothetical protein